MLSFSTAFESSLAARATTLTVCWFIQSHTGVSRRGTAHDRNVVINTGPYTGTYRARSCMLPTDVEVRSDGGAANSELSGTFLAVLPDLTVEEVEAGIWDQALAGLLLVDWTDPDRGQKELLVGTLGEFRRDSDGGYRTDVRGPGEALNQQIMDTYASRCTVREFGDHRCGFDVSAVARTGTVTSVTSRKRFVAELDPGPAPVTAVYYNGARLRFTSGANDTFVRDVKACIVEGDVAEILLWEETPADIAAGNTIYLPPGCDRSYLTCRHAHNNVVNMRAYGVFASGKDALMRGPSDGVTLEGLDAALWLAVIDQAELRSRLLLGMTPP